MDAAPARNAMLQRVFDSQPEAAEQCLRQFLQQLEVGSRFSDDGVAADEAHSMVRRAMDCARGKNFIGKDEAPAFPRNCSPDFRQKMQFLTSWFNRSGRTAAPAPYFVVRKARPSVCCCFPSLNFPNSNSYMTSCHGYLTKKIPVKISKI